MSEQNANIDISVVIPVYGCPTAIPALHERLTNVLTGMGVEYEIIMVDDCDKMNSWEEVKKVAEKDPRVKAIHFTKNHGQGVAVTAGVHQSAGKWIITMDCDLQDAPENIPDLYAKVNEGYDVVFVRRQQRKESFLVRLFAKWYHNVLAWLSGVDFDYDLATYLIASRRATDYYIASKDRGRDFGVFLMWLGFKYTFVNYEQGYRYEGKSSFTFIKKVRTAVGIISTYSNRPLYVSIWIGLISAVFSFIYIIYAFIQYYVYDANPEGWTTVAAAIFFFGGAILSTLGVMGIYLGNIFDMSKDRPLFTIQETINI
ncbi:MAG: glycosyltransferase family 2 protein [Lachnospiraceae bacterium]|nr:glycosyltransferase family 2 protein [Lachnospiraceae bacterium]